MIEKSFYCHLLYFYVLKRRNLIKESWGQVFDSITSLAVDASQHNVVDACPALNSSDSRHKRINNARSNIINGYISSFVAGRIKNLSL